MRYKLFGKSGLRVSELCLGTMTFGTKGIEWGADYDTSKEIFDLYANMGGNFLDTANRYTDGTSELFLGEFIHEDRDHFVLATKYSIRDKMGDPNYCGNHRKNLRRSIEASLKRLKTGYIDILWLHAWDFTTPVEEVLRSLDDLISAGKVNYIGISNTPAWIIAQANTLAELRGWSSFMGIQIEYSLLERTAEREILPLAKSFDLAITPWAPLGAGILTGKYLKKESGRLQPGNYKLTPTSEKIASAVVEVAKDVGCSPAQVALNWLRQKNQVVIPILGARKLEQLKDTMGCLSFELDKNHLNQLSQVSAIDLGVPHEQLRKEASRQNLFGGTFESIDNHRS
ncbi:aldo/keto reductase [Xanthovirga aplysinae]|uniref:aldo/keto reductase n=1 Tax=Xanthovirga aplysinae TaxID=2529853 RepID=UPI0012BBBE8A|nr:aldo/keto reductase [Xanthovirga aplysinae]MTI30268.1 aldo/keto reductase [Xanthovirga aplysinae]